MSDLSTFAYSGVWDNRNTIVSAAIAIPLAVEGLTLAKNIYEKPNVIKEKLLSAKKTVIESFTLHEGEKRLHGILRIAKNTFYLLSCLALMGGAIYGSVILLPGALAVTSAISAVFMIGKLFMNAGRYKRELLEAFKAKEGEDPQAAKQRIRKNIMKAVAIGIVTIATIGIGAYIIAPMVAHGFTFAVSLPMQTKAVVFAEYASIGALHGGLACYKWKNGDKWGALFHLFAGALCFVFPSYYLTHSATSQMRLHHSFSGLLLMATPFRPVQMLGSAIAFDSGLYMLSAARSHGSYDFINTIVDNYPKYAGGYAGALMLENINDNWKEKSRTPSPAEKQPA